MEKINFEKGIKLFVSPTNNRFDCGVIKDEFMYSDEGYLCSVIARGMMRIACDNPQYAFDQGIEGFSDDEKNKKTLSNNGELPEEGANIIDIVPFLSKKKLN